MKNHHRHFSRFAAIMAAVTSLLANSNTAAGMSAGKGMSRAEALNLAGGYSSNGKNKTKTHNRGGTRAHQRQVQKKHNQRRNRLAHRG